MMLLKISTIWKTSLIKLVLPEKLNIYKQKRALIQNKSKFIFFKKFTLFSTFISITNKDIIFYLWESFKNVKKKKYSFIKQNLKFQKFEQSNQNTYLFQRPLLKSFQWAQKGDLISDCSASSKGELALGKNLLVGYMPWEGFNFEDAVLINEKIVSKYTSLHIEKYDFEICKTGSEKITRNIPGIDIQKLDKNGIIKIGSWVEEGDVLVGIIIPFNRKTLVTYEKLLYDIVNKKIQNQKMLEIQEKCLRAPEGVSGRIIRIICKNNNENPNIIESLNQHNNNNNSSLKKITVYIAKKKNFKVGDKISGRHGNKGIISKILSNSDMPYMVNGNTLDVLLNPLGVPSRMNVGQILECLLGFTGKIFNTQFKIICFDEMYGYEASRSFVYSKLFESCKKTNQKWLFNKKTPGKFHLFDGRNGQSFSQPIMVGTTYLMKLIHIVDEKIHARSTGPYSLITQQPLRGRGKHGGQRLGEMEVWALQGFGCIYTLQELLTIKSDDVDGRNKILQTLLKNTSITFDIPDSFYIILRELKCLCLDLQLFKSS
uniref:DNA-directed RNA polymerase n=1 Tax=Glaukea argentea TaxID=2894057 RepID=A0A386B1G5_9CHLO|nr:RNA polymerase b-subunit [Udotea argentea]AYC65544.1 RNA polymerase b-subunit [Udotea argentea]